MLFEIIIAIIVIFILIKLVKAIGSVLLKLVKRMFRGIFLVFYFLIAGPAIICTKLFYWLTKILHIQTLAYFLLSLFSVQSFIYLCFVHIPYSLKERFIKVKECFFGKRKERFDIIAMSFFLNLEGALLFFLGDNDIMFYFGLGFVGISFIYVLYKCSEWKKANKEFYEYCKEWRKWTLEETEEITESQIEERLINLSAEIAKNDKNKNKFTIENIPYGRATAFISYFQKNLDDEEPIYFSPKMSASEEELREYGILITTKGIYISKQDKDDIELPYYGLWKVENNKFDYGLSFGKLKSIELSEDDTPIELSVLIELINGLRNVSLAMLQNKVKTDFDEAFESYIEAESKNTQEKFDASQRVKNISTAAELGGIGVGLQRNAQVYAEVKNNFDGKQGHGTAAEYANTTIDKLLGKNAQAIGADNAKGGADRIVNGVNIQSKYCATARQSINKAFESTGSGTGGDGKALYLNEDGSMMRIEVPRDQYVKAIEVMKEKIQNGQVPIGTDADGRVIYETDPNNAPKYVGKGHVFYLQSYNIAGSGSIESILADTASGVICSLPGAGITTVLTFATAVWNGQDLKVAAKQGAMAGGKVMLKGSIIFMLTMQLSRGKIVNPFYSSMLKAGKSANKYVKNPVSAGARKIVKKFHPEYQKAEVAQASRKLISTGITVVVVYGPDVCKAFQGKISGKQLVKNTVINTAGLAGGAAGAAAGTAIAKKIGTAVGSAFGPIGGFAGGALAGFVAKKVLDAFIEDDTVAMFRIMREEFLDIVMLFNFNKEEFDKIVSATIANPNMSKVLQNMYQSGEPKEYADALINAEVRLVLGERKKITNEMIEEGMTLLLEDKSVA